MTFIVACLRWKQSTWTQFVFTVHADSFRRIYAFVTVKGLNGGEAERAGSDGRAFKGGIALRTPLIDRRLVASLRELIINSIP